MLFALFVAVGAYKATLDSLVVSLASTGTQKKHYSLSDATFSLLNADDTQTLVIDATIVDEKKNKVNPRQVALLLTASADTVLPAGMPRTQQLPFDADDGKGGRQLTTSLGGKAFYSINGVYDLELVVGDLKMENAIQHKLGPMKMSFSEQEETIDITIGKQRIYSLQSEQALSANPPIVHKFNVPEKRPPFLTSLVFFLLAGPAAGMALIIGLKAMGANAGFFPAGSAKLLALGFQACLITGAVLLVCFWLFLNIMEVSRYLIPLGIATVIIGHRAMCETKDRRSKAVEGASKKAN